MGENNIDQLPLTHSQLGTWPTTQACALTENRTGDLSVCEMTPNPLSHTSEGKILFFFFKRVNVGREGEIHGWIASCTSPSQDKPWPGTTHKLGMCSDWEPNKQPFALRDNVQPTERHQLGGETLFECPCYLWEQQEVSPATDTNMAAGWCVVFATLEVLSFLQHELGTSVLANYLAHFDNWCSSFLL